MKRVIFIFGILLAFACTKTEAPAIPPVLVAQEEVIKFSTNLDTGTYNVADTLPLMVTVSSKLPSTGIIYSILVNWTDSSKQIFKLDTIVTVSSLSLNIPGLKKSGTYSLSLSVTSKSTSTNTLNKSISVVNNPLGRFMGYKVDQAALSLSKQKDFGRSYWRNSGVMMDLIIDVFQKPLLTNTFAVSQNFWGGALQAITTGDFNNDDTIQALTEEVTSLRQENLTLQQQILNTATTSINQ